MITTVSLYILIITYYPYILFGNDYTRDIQHFSHNFHYVAGVFVSKIIDKGLEKALQIGDQVLEVNRQSVGEYIPKMTVHAYYSSHPAHLGHFYDAQH